MTSASANPDEMQHYAAFHQGLHCLPKYPFRDFQKGLGTCMVLLKLQLSKDKPKALKCDSIYNIDMLF